MPRPRSRPARRPTAAAALATAAFLTSLPLTSPRARAADATWSSPTSGRWLDPTRWSTGAVPTNSTDTATINALGSYTVTLDNGTSAGAITLNAPDATLSVAAQPSYYINFYTGPLTISAGTLAVHTSATSDVQIWPTSFTNAGTVTLDTATTPTGTTPRVDFETRSTPVVNSGTILAHAAPPPTPPYSGNYYPAIYNFTGSPGETFTNTGTLHADPGAIFQLKNYTLTNTGTLDGIELYSGSLNYNGGSCSPTAPVYLSGSPLSIAKTATNGNFVLDDGSDLKTNIPAGNTVSTWLDSTVRWSGTGSTLTNAGRLAIGYSNRAITPSGTAPTLNLYGGTLLNTGTLELNSTSAIPADINGYVTNQGTLIVHAPGSSTSYPRLTTVDRNFTQNAGSLAIDPATSLSIYSPYSYSVYHFYFNGGTVAGNVSLSNATVDFAPGLANTGSGTFTYSTTVVSNSTTSAATPFTGNIASGATFVHTAGNATTTFYFYSFTNNGALRTSWSSGVTRLTYGVNNFQSTGTLTNTGSLGGTVNGADRGISLQLNGNLTNTGDIKAYSLTVSGAAFNQNAGTLDVNNLCNVVSGATFNYNGGTLTGNPVALNASTLNLAPNTNPASFTFYGSSNTLHGSPSPGSTLALDLPFVTSSTISVTASPFTNPGTLSLAATPAVANDTLTVTGSGILTNSGTLSVTQGKGGTRTLNANLVNTGTLSVGPGATLTLNGSLSTSTPLDLQGTLDLKLSPLTWTGLTDPAAASTAADTLRSLLSTAHLTSSSADSLHRLGYLLSPTTNTITVKLTIQGDANLDGKITPDDYALLDRGLSTGGTTWSNGDFSYDGTVDQADYLLIDTALAQTTHSFSPDLLAQRESQFGDQYVQALLTSVPEPTSPLLLLTTGYWLLATSPRRRSRSNRAHP